ncbi:MAG TPA: hypothetical protein DHV59_13870 [Oxalobacteraceae bacterium]|nr:hypothetical protein [Oxalobacteraceae bacterium]
MNHAGILALALAFSLAFYLPAQGHCANVTPDSRRVQPAPSSTKKEQPPPRRRVPALAPETLAIPTTTTLASTSRQSPANAMPRPAQPVPADRPVPVTGCDPGGCWDGSGNRYNSGAGNTYLNNAGKLCTRNGTWMQCF